jgi:benzoyl-CoA reductase subunit C
MADSLAEVLARAEAACADVDLVALANWKAGGGHAIGCTPGYVPMELADASGALPVYLFGGTPSMETVQGEAYFQSAICHLPRTLLDLGLRGALDGLDLLIVPSTCDVLRNLTGVWKITLPHQRVHYLDLPQRYDADGYAFYRRELHNLREAIEQAVGDHIGDDDLRRSIATFDWRRRVLRALDELRAAEPWRAPTSEIYLMVRAGATMLPAEHVELLVDYLEAVRAADRKPLDLARVVMTGAFCEQPPIGLLRTLERAGCAIVDDDLLASMRWLGTDIELRDDEDPLDALARAYLLSSPLLPSRYEGDQRRPDVLVDRVRKRRASGVILASPSFCDPALLDRPGLLEGLEHAAIPCVQLQYAENSSDFGSVREQTGTFADAIRLWENL